jgi:hypothetical protein
MTRAGSDEKSNTITGASEASDEEGKGNTGRGRVAIGEQLPVLCGRDEAAVGEIKQGYLVTFPNGLKLLRR